MGRSIPSGRNKPGTVPKGDRSAITVRVPLAHREVYAQRAREQGYESLSDYLGAQMALRHNLEVPEYVRRRRPGQDGQESLPIAG